MNNLKLIACDIDGVLLEDTFSPVLYKLAQKYGVPYTAELENNTFSQKRSEAADFIKKNLNLPEDITIESLLKEYFSERSNFLKSSKDSTLSGVPEFLKMLQSLNITLVCYGGLKKEMIDPKFQPYLKYFDRYVCTNDFRPGLKEIVTEYGVDFSQALFIDDVNRVAEEAKKYGTPFIGIPANHSWGFQESEMKKTGVKYIVHSVKEITKDFLKMVDSDDSIW
ncbi:HAD family hydrolase [Streptococcus sp. H49]|uniref:HAD family hydrolase n=1 Tax=Streptococcus huangxiaojuni TaxID=3237239 RepID=UPI0034A55131